MLAGVQQILRNISRAKRVNLEALEKGLLKAGKFLQRESQKVVPVDTGALRGSAFTRVYGSGRKDRLRVVVGYTMSYAIYVHENTFATHKPGKIAKYLEVPARRFRDEMRQIIFAELRKAQ